MSATIDDPQGTSRPDNGRILYEERLETQAGLFDRFDAERHRPMVAQINSVGELVFAWQDEVADEALLDLGEVVIATASYVEPAPMRIEKEGNDSAGWGWAWGWTADLSPVGGPVLGPFTMKNDALEAERNWLDANL